MLKWFRRGPSPHQTALAMIGAKPGDRILVAGRPDPGLVAELGLVSGLNGQTLVMGADPALQSAIEKAAADAGALIDFAPGDGTGRLQGGASSWDLVLLAARLSDTPEAQRAAWLTAALEALRPGGRLMLVDGAKRRAFSFGTNQTEPAPASDVVVGWLLAAGGVAARLLATSEGVGYYEARRTR